jgi:hypothetical protein
LVGHVTGVTGCAHGSWFDCIQAALIVVPGVGEVADAIRATREAAALSDAVRVATDVGRIEARAAETVDAAEMSGYRSFSAAKRALESPGEGNVFDHVVEQSQIGRSGFTPEEIHNPFNMNPVSAETNQLKANYYSSKQFFTGGGTVRDWLTGQSFADQYEFGMDVLMRIRQGVLLL